MASFNEKDVCKNKRRFGNQQAADEAIKRINPSKALNKPRRSYKCSICSGYHLSSKSS